MMAEVNVSGHTAIKHSIQNLLKDPVVASAVEFNQSLGDLSWDGTDIHGGMGSTPGKPKLGFATPFPQTSLVCDYQPYSWQMRSS